MIKLYGTAVSNYYAMVKVFLLEKGFEFEEVYIAPTYSEPFLELSPMGKVPCIEVDEGYLSETTAILGFLESCVPEVPMVSRDPFKSAQMAQLIKVVELYIANASGRVVGSAFFGQDLNEEVAADSRSQVQRGLAALDRLGSFSPYIMGEEISMADFFAYYIFASARPIARRVWGWDIVAEVDGLGDWLKLMSGRPMVQQVNAEFNDAVAKIIL